MLDLQLLIVQGYLLVTVMTCCKIEEWLSVSNHAAYIKCWTLCFGLMADIRPFRIVCCSGCIKLVWICCSFYCTYHAVKSYFIYCTEKVSKHEVEEKLRQLVSTRFVEICTTDSQEKEDEQTDLLPPSKRLKSESQVCMNRAVILYSSFLARWENYTETPHRSKARLW